MNNCEIISIYTRSQAISDGVLVDVSTDAWEAGFCAPVAVTRGVWDQYVRVPDGVAGQDEAGRLWDILWMLQAAMAQMPRNYDDPFLPFRLHVRNDNTPGTPPLVTLKAHCGPDENGTLCLTLLLPDED